MDCPIGSGFAIFPCAVARVDDALLDAYQVKAFPTYYLVGPDGRILFAGIPDRDPEAEPRPRRNEMPQRSGGDSSK